MKLFGPPDASRRSLIRRSGVVSILDIGSSKICCVIAQVSPDPDAPASGAASADIRILGMGHQLSQGIRAGSVVDIDAAERAIRAAVDRAERAAGLTVGSVFVNVSGGRPSCSSYSAAIKLSDARVRATDLECVVRLARADIDTGGRILLHSAPVSYALDATRGVRQPEGMFADVLGVDWRIHDRCLSTMSAISASPASRWAPVQPLWASSWRAT